MLEKEEVITEKEFIDNSTINEKVDPDNELKTWLVNYVGGATKPKNEEVTVENIVNVMAEEFPEFLMAIAEENWIRGYHQALTDVEEGEKLLKSESSELSDEEWVKGYKKCKNCE